MIWTRKRPIKMLNNDKSSWQSYILQFWRPKKLSDYRIWESEVEKIVKNWEEKKCYAICYKYIMGDRI